MVADRSLSRASASFSRVSLAPFDVRRVVLVVVQLEDLGAMVGSSAA